MPQSEVGSEYGTEWRDDELDAIVEDYFAMRGKELAGAALNKAQHSRVLMERIRRTHRSVEFKHQNISAVLEELGLTWIRGYKPKRNYQGAIFGAIERYLDRHPETLETPVERAAVPENAEKVFVAEVERRTEPEGPEGLRRLVKKFDPAERDQKNRALGKAGEEFVVELERRRLTEGTRGDLARRVRWVAQEDGDGAGYDVFSFEPTGQERLLEVKTTNGPARTPFWLTRNELGMAAERPGEWRIYRVHLFASGARVLRVAPPLEGRLSMRPEVWKAEVRG